jgi:N-acetylglutamate synthase-like GNAT family acetyltransferase
LIPAEVRPHVNTQAAACTYVLYQHSEIIGWGQILEHLVQGLYVYELAYLQIIPKYRKSGYGRILARYMVYHHSAREIFLTTIQPEYFHKLGFQETTTYPFKLDHQTIDCQSCQPAKCRVLYFKKPEFLRKFGCDEPVYDQYNQLVQSQQFMRSEFSAVNGYIWSCTENIYAIELQGFMFFVFFPFNENPYGVIFPYRELKDEQIKNYLDKLRLLNVQNVRYLSWYSVQRLQAVKNPDYRPVQVLPDRDNFDYLYKVNTFASFAGGDFEKKRNRLKKFSKNNPGFQVVKYSPQGNAEVLAFATRVIQDDLKIPLTSLEVLSRGLEHKLFQGFLVKIKTKIIGLILFSELNRDTIIVHFEFTDQNYDGVSPFMNNYLGKMLQGKYLFINREQDLGIAGLRKSKLSYRPYRLLSKYTAVYDLAKLKD